MIGRTVRLEPMTIEHLPALVEAGLHPELWQWIPTPVTTPDEMGAYVETALDEARRGVSIPFVIIDRATDRVIGSTRYANMSTADRHLEIGWTWITPAFQRTAANTETKLLLLTHAFEQDDCIAVGFRTAFFNMPSRRAIERLGAKLDGIWRDTPALVQ